MIYNNITLFILCFTLFIQYKRYGIKVLLHPSLYFLVTWILSVLSFNLFNILGLDILIINKNILNELFIFVSFTSLCFIFFGINKVNRIKKSIIEINLKIPYSLYKFFSFFFLIVSIGAIFNSGIDVAATREASVSAANNFASSGERLGILDTFMGVISWLGLPFIIYSGFIIGNSVFDNYKIQKVYYFPLLAVFFNTVAGGGRAAIISGMSFFLIGVFLSLFSKKRDYYNAMKPIIKYVLVFFVLFSIYTTFVSDSRSIKQTGNNSTIFTEIVKNNYPILKPFAGVIEYSVFHFQGYQYRRVDTLTPELELGQFTFAFITTFNVPVISQLANMNFSIQNIFSLKDVNPIRSTIKASEDDLDGSSITATVFFLLFDDFGFYGSLIVIVIFVGFTQKLYERLFLKKSKNFISIILFVAIYHLWTLTFFSHHLLSSWFNGFIYPVIVIEYWNYRNKKVVFNYNPLGEKN